MSVVPREVLTEIIITDNTSYNEFDTQSNTQTRKSFNSNPMFMVVTPTLQSTPQTKLGFEVKTSKNNKYNVPIKWSFTDSDNNVLNGTSMIVEKSFVSRFFNRSLVANYQNAAFINFGGIKFNFKNSQNILEFLNPNIDVVDVKVEGFNSNLKSKVYLVENPNLNLEIDFNALQFDYNDNLLAKQLIILRKFQNKFGDNIDKINNAIQSNKIFRSQEKVCNYTIGTTTPSLSYYLSEDSNSDKITETIEYKHKFAGAELKCTKSFDVLEFATKASPILYGFKKLDDYITAVDIYAKVDFSFSIGADLNASIPFEREFSVTNKKSFGEGNASFSIEPKIRFTASPKVGGKALNYYAEGSFDVFTELECPIVYEPTTTKLTFGDAILNPLKIRGFKLESFEKDARGNEIKGSVFKSAVEFSIWKESITLYKKETIYLNDEN